MLLKLFVDDTFPFCDIKTAMTVNWIVHDNLPLGHPQNVESVMRAIGLPRKPNAGEPFGSTYIHINGRVIDPSVTAGENSLGAGSVLTFSLTKPVSANATRSARSNTQFSGGNNNNDDDDDEDRDSEAESGSEAGDSPRNSRSGTMNSARSRASSKGSSGGDDEVYTAPECGWFPFIVSSGARRAQFGGSGSGGSGAAKPGGKQSGRKSPGGSDSETTETGRSAVSDTTKTESVFNRGAAAGGDNNSAPNSATNTPRAGPELASSTAVGPSVKFTPRNVTSVRVMNAYDEPEPEDTEPRSFDLCQKCSDIVSSGVQTAAENVLHVERHYRPMTVDTETISVWLDKLGGGRISRWQRRWFMFTEKSVDWYEKQPAVDQREKVKGSLMINVEGKFMVSKIVENPTPDQYPDVAKSGAGAYYFVLCVENAKRDKIYYRAATEQDRKTVCQFLNKLKSRSEARGGNTRDPVFWKQWANSLLVSTSDMAELRIKKEQELRDVESDIKNIKNQMEGLNSGRDNTQAQLSYQRGLADRLEKELLAATRRNAELDRSVKEVRGSVDTRREELSHSLGKSEENSHRAKILEQEALSEKKRAIIALAEIREENERIERRIEELFSKWRRVEEHHVESAFRPSTLAPADIAARAARDYEARTGQQLGGNTTNRSIGPMQTVSAETFTPKKRTIGGSGGATTTTYNELSPIALSSGSQNNNNNNNQSSLLSSSRIQGSSLSSPTARLHDAVRDVLFDESGNGNTNNGNGNTNNNNNVNVKDAARQSGSRITFGISAALGYTPGSSDALSPSSSRRRRY